MLREPGPFPGGLPPNPACGRWETVCLDDTSRRAVFLGAGLGHAFTALSDEATVIYLCSTSYSPGREHGVHPLDPDLGIAWPTDTEPVLSPRDAAAPTLEQARRAGLLPIYADCEAYLGSLRKAADARTSLSGDDLRRATATARAGGGSVMRPRTLTLSRKPVQNASALSMEMRCPARLLSSRCADAERFPW